MYLVELEENLPLLSGQKHFALFSPSSPPWLTCTSGTKAIEGHLDGSRLDLDFVRDVAVFTVKLAEELHSVIEVLNCFGRV